MKPFIYSAQANNVVFGVGTLIKVADEVRSLGITRVFLIADGSAAGIGDSVEVSLGSLLVARWNEVAQHVPVDVATRARAAYEASGANGVVCVGGGSSTGLAKAIALTHSSPIVAIPTTYAGSEQTAIYGLTGGAHKQTGKNNIVLPKTVIYDPALTVGLPSGVTGPSAFNAIAHCIEALYGPGNNPVISVIALESIRAIAASLHRVIETPKDLEARGELLYGAYLGGVALGATGTALHHKACHVLGGMFNLVHGDMNSVVLPHALAYNAPAIPELMPRISLALGGTPSDHAPQLLFDLATSIGAPTSLASIGMRADGIGAAAERTVEEVNANLSANPRTVGIDSVEKMLTDAFYGRRPS
jgi:maleylacetate reductase